MDGGEATRREHVPVVEVGEREVERERCGGALDVDGALGEQQDEEDAQHPEEDRERVVPVLREERRSIKRWRDDLGSSRGSNTSSLKSGSRPTYETMAYTPMKMTASSTGTEQNHFFGASVLGMSTMTPRHRHMNQSSPR